MAAPPKSLVQDRTVVLDEAIPPLEGKRVRVALERADEPVLTGVAGAEAWRQWLTSGPQGPIEDDGEPESP